MGVCTTGKIVCVCNLYDVFMTRLLAEAYDGLEDESSSFVVVDAKNAARRQDIIDDMAFHRR